MELPPPPPSIDLSASRVQSCQASIFVTWSLAVIAVVLRFCSRHISGASLWIDDWLMIIGLAFSSVFSFVCASWQIHYGLGMHIWVSSDPAKSMTVMLGGLFISELAYTFSILFIKLSILALYWRIFKKTILVPIIILFTIVVGWAIGVFVISLVQCRPLRGFWDKSITSTCKVNVYDFFIGNAVPNIVTDFALLTLPLSVIWRLQMSTYKKIGVSTCFLLGCFVSAVSIYRLCILLQLDLQDPDVTWTFTPPQMWTAVEQNVAIISGCLPSLKPVMSYLQQRRRSTSSRSSSKNLFSYRQTSDNPFSSTRHQTSVSSGASSQESEKGDEEDLTPKSFGARTTVSRMWTSQDTDSTRSENDRTITVRRDFEVAWHQRQANTA